MNVKDEMFSLPVTQELKQILVWISERAYFCSQLLSTAMWPPTQRLAYFLWAQFHFQSWNEKKKRFLFPQAVHKIGFLQNKKLTVLFKKNNSHQSKYMDPKYILHLGNEWNKGSDWAVYQSTGSRERDAFPKNVIPGKC